MAHALQTPENGNENETKLETKKAHALHLSVCLIFFLKFIFDFYLMKCLSTIYSYELDMFECVWVCHVLAKKILKLETCLQMDKYIYLL